MRGVTLTAGGTSEEISKSIDTEIFAHCRRLLRGWKVEHEKQFGAGSWAAAGMPDPATLGLHRLAEQTLLMSDTCNGARLAKQLLAKLAEAAGRAEIGEDKWAEMSEAERDTRCRSYIGDCAGHMRNIIITNMAKGATKHLSAHLLLLTTYLLLTYRTYFFAVTYLS